MRKLIALFVALAGLSMIAVEADAKRVGGGRSVGMQRQATPQPPAKAPTQQQATPQQQQAQTPPAAPPAKQPSGMSRWLGPLAGLAIGAGLASLFMGNGMGGALMGILLIAAIGFGIMMLIRMFRGRAQQHQPLRYAGADAFGRSEPIGVPPSAPAAAPVYGGSAAPHSVAATTSSAAPDAAAANRWPADFDAEEFAKHAKSNFHKLQEANDRRDIAALRDFMTPDLVREIEAEIRASGDAPQKTEVVTLDAQVLDVETEATRYIVSLRFSGLIRETPGTEPQPFSEIWHLEKPLNGRSGWLVAGIQQA
jgi:predicted lipid-binding transport protein (Tim44 family)